MEKNEIIEICSKWAQQDNKRIAVVLLGEPENNGGINYSQMLYGQPLRISQLLAAELESNADFSAVVGTAAAAAAGMKRKKEK